MNFSCFSSLTWSEPFVTIISWIDRTRWDDCSHSNCDIRATGDRLSQLTDLNTVFLYHIFLQSFFFSALFCADLKSRL